MTILLFVLVILGFYFAAGILRGWVYERKLQTAIVGSRLGRSNVALSANSISDRAVRVKVVVKTRPK